MSTKKDKFTKKDYYYMDLAYSLARNQEHRTGLNPSVGCLVVKKNKIISRGATSLNGRPHAEVIALRNIKKKNYGSTVYLTLEPCSHYGKTPPCTKTLIKSRVKKVIFSIEDHDFRSFKKAKKILNSKGIIVKTGLRKKKMGNFYKKYIYVRKNKTSYVIGKLACSSDFNILNNNTPITNQHSRKITHLLRYENEGILTTYKTINKDDPKLNCRINGLEKFSPTILIIDRFLKINKNSQIFNKKSYSKLILFHCSKNKNKINLLKKKGIKMVFIKTDTDNFFNLKKIIKKCYDLGIHSILVESGKKLINNMILKNTINEFYLLKSDKVLTNKKKINVSIINKNLNKMFKNKKFVNTYLDKDKLIHFY